MSYVSVLVWSCLVTSSWSLDLTFPPGFKFGAATSAYQTEGAWNISDKTESMCDQYMHYLPSRVSDGSSGDVACDSYHQWEQDVQIAAKLGLDMYRFSISWTRVLPNGFSDYISEDGKNYYSNLIDALLEKGIEPAVTMYQFDLPQRLQNLGGWANPLIANWFGDYARVLFSLYGDRVKMWLTINEPVMVCDAGYEGYAPPALDDPDVGMYFCVKNLLMAHATAWRIYDEEFKPKYHGKVSMTSLFFWFEPISNEDKEVTELTREFMESKYSHPIYSAEGGWPPKLKAFLDERSKKPTHPYFGLPDLTQKEIEFIRGTFDFYGLNHYTTRMVRKVRPDDEIGIWPFDGPKELGVVQRNNPMWKTADASWISVYPEGLRKQIAWLRHRYGNIEFIITENGYISSDKDFDDYERVAYIRGYMEQVLISMKEDGAKITGYIVWSMIDQFEWTTGYELNFGLYSVNFSSPQKTRTPRASAHYYAKVIATRRLILPDSTV